MASRTGPQGASATEDRKRRGRISDDEEDPLIRRSVQRIQPVRVHSPQVRVYRVSDADALVRCCLPGL